MNIYRTIVGQLADFLAKPRDVVYVRRTQLILLAITVIGVTLILSYSSLVQADLDLRPGGPWAVGRNAQETVVAAHAIELQRMDQYELARKDAAQKAPLQFIRDFGVLAAAPAGSNAKAFRDLLNDDIAALSVCRTDPVGLRPCVRGRIPRWGRIQDLDLALLLRNTDQRVQENLTQAVNIAFQNFIVVKERFVEPEFSGSFVETQDVNAGSDIVRNSIPIERVVNPRERLYAPETAKRIDDVFRDQMKLQDPALRDALVQAAIAYLYAIHGSRFSKDDTEAARRQAMSTVAIPIYRINRGEAIVKKDEAITDEKFEALSRHKRARAVERIERVLAILIQQVFITGLLVYFAVRFAYRKIADVSSNLIIFVTVWVFAAVLLLVESIWAGRADYNEVSHYFGSWVPMGLFSVILALVFGDAVAIPISIYLSFLVFLASKNDGNSLIIAAGVGVVGALLGSRIHKRVHFITTGIALAVVGSVLVTACTLYGDRAIFATMSSSDVFSPGFKDSIRATAISGLGTVAAIAILPVYESVFNIPTRFKLAELADPTSPLLKEMFRRAPSTWQHTLMVAAMVEKACERLGLNTILARTGIYYHDIGKMKNAGFFVENQHLIPKPENIDVENPAKAAKVIIDHVLDGIAMARAARLPREVLAFIPEHHGTSTMSFFYHKALEKMKRRVRREDFRYPGPKPQSKETAIAMIADSLEAASRSLDEVNQASVDALIHKIIGLKMAENQLDESGITLGDLVVIHEAFRDVILSSYHFRPKYPDKKKTDRLERNQAPKRRRK